VAGLEDVLGQDADFLAKEKSSSPPAKEQRSKEKASKLQAIVVAKRLLRRQIKYNKKYNDTLLRSATRQALIETEDPHVIALRREIVLDDGVLEDTDSNLHRSIARSEHKGMAHACLTMIKSVSQSPVTRAAVVAVCALILLLIVGKTDRVLITPLHEVQKVFKKVSSNDPSVLETITAESACQLAVESDDRTCRFFAIFWPFAVSLRSQFVNTCEMVIAATNKILNTSAIQDLKGGLFLVSNILMKVGNQLARSLPSVSSITERVANAAIILTAIAQMIRMYTRTVAQIRDQFYDISDSASELIDMLPNNDATQAVKNVSISDEFSKIIQFNFQ
jgi:hypothetical protein